MRPSRITGEQAQQQQTTRTSVSRRQHATAQSKITRLFSGRDVQAKLGKLLKNEPSQLSNVLGHINRLPLDEQETAIKILGEAMACAMMTVSTDSASSTTQQFVHALSQSNDFAETSPAWQVLIEEANPETELPAVLSAYSRQFGTSLPQVTRLRDNALVTHASKAPGESIYHAIVTLPNGPQLLARAFEENPAWPDDISAAIQRHMGTLLLQSTTGATAAHCA